MPQPNDLSRSLVALDQNSTIIAVIELSHSAVHGLPLRPEEYRHLRWSGDMRDGISTEATRITSPYHPTDRGQARGQNRARFSER
jgi:hypothetical protein